MGKRRKNIRKKSGGHQNPKKSCSFIQKISEESEKNMISEEQLIEIHFRAYYKAMKKLEDDKRTEVIKAQKEIERDKWYKNILFFFNIMLCPWKMFFKYNPKIHDSLFVVLIWSVYGLLGLLGWLSGWIIVVYGFSQYILAGMLMQGLVITLFGVAAIVLGSAFIVSGENFSKETDSNKIYAYTANVISLVSCIIAIIALVKV